ncbi:Integration host factor subunit alpha [uncultured Desulfatiglans sp.]|uniref:Integration host factor subunit alpha n=1 Tax=Uncultured Desulfatiglans sp. TaxID=1748965 RepID=A0A653AA50_UNCDX|nr:Integration host factor subunit alpha [uncultured Desulfatiglans sp.]
MTITKSNLIDQLYHQCGISKTDATEALETTLKIIKQTLAEGEPVIISGFGKFEVKDMKPRRGRNPATGNDLTLDARRVGRFKCSGVLKERLNGK